MKEYEYKVHEPKIVAILAGVYLFVGLIIVLIGVDQIITGYMTQLGWFLGCTIAFLLPGILLLVDYKRRALYVIRSGHEYCYVPLIGKKRYFRREDIASAKLRWGNCFHMGYSIVATDHNGKKLFSVEDNMVNAEKIVCIAQNEFQKGNNF